VLVLVLVLVLVVVYLREAAAVVAATLRKLCQQQQPLLW
jgi:hypothetical protein